MEAVKHVADPKATAPAEVRPACGGDPSPLHEVDPTGADAPGGTVETVKDEAAPEPANDEVAGESAGLEAAGSGAQPASASTGDPGSAPTGGSESIQATPGDDTEDGDVRDPLRFNNWMKRSTTGAVMTGIAVGLQQALQLPRQEPAFVIEASGEPHDPNNPIDLRFDPDNPADTVAIIRRPAAVDPPDESPPPGSSPPA
jgi:hypothetical protein